MVDDPMDLAGTAYDVTRIGLPDAVRVSEFRRLDGSAPRPTPPAIPAGPDYYERVRWKAGEEPPCDVCLGARYVRGRAPADRRACPRCTILFPLEERLRRCGFDRVVTFDDWHAGGAMEQAAKAAHEFVTSESWCLFIRSAVGSGKTMLAQAVGTAFMRDGLGVARFWNVGDLLVDARDTFGDDADGLRNFLVRQVYYADLLVLDDLGAQRATPFGMETLFLIVDHFYRRRAEGKKLLVTSNVAPGDPDEQERIGDRMLDRLSPGELVVRGAPSRRKEFDR